MLNSQLERGTPEKADKNVQHHDSDVLKMPRGTVLLSVLKTLENQLQARKIIQETCSATFNPIWFLAETERNIFLWRRGCSLVQADDFEFWVNIPALLEKRNSQLRSFEKSNPFLNPFWGMEVQDEAIAEQESEYLESLTEALSQIENHARALSQVGSLLAQEIGGEPQKEVVILPCQTLSKPKQEST